MRFEPCRHLHRKRHKQKNTSDQRGIKKIFTYASEGDFGYDYRDKTSDKNHPYRHIGRQIEGEQQTGDDCRQISGRGFDFHKAAGRIFKQDAAGNRRQFGDQGIKPEKYQRSRGGRNKSDYDVTHNFRCVGF